MINGITANHERPEDNDHDHEYDDDDDDYEYEFLPMASHGLAPSHPTLPPTLSTTPRPAFVHPPFHFSFRCQFR